MVRIWVVILTVFLVILTTLFFIGAMANQAPAAQLEGFGLEDAEKAEFGGPNFHPSTVTHFIKAAISGVMPGGVKTSQALFPKEYMQQFSTKYVDWAPPPFDKLPPPAVEMGPINMGPMPGDSPAPIIRVMHVISGMDRMFSPGFINKSQDLKPSSKAMRSRLWWGMPPMSDALWASKGLDEEGNIEEAMAIIQQAVNVFKHQMKPDVQGEMRTTHNKVWCEIDVFHDAIVALRSQNGEAAPEFNIAKLWQEYSKLHFQNMENQGRAWAFKRLNVLYTIWKDRMMRMMTSGRQINATQGTIRIDHWAMMILNKLLDLYVEVEIFIRCRTDGFSMIHGIDYRLTGAITLEKTESELNAIYAEIENKRVSDLKGILASVQAARTAARNAAEPMPDFLEAPGITFDREFSMRSLMKQMDTPLPLGVEAWVQDLADDKKESFGFVVYRNTYVQSEVEWKSFVETWEAALNSGWEGVLDPENVKRKAMLHWIDGKQEGIPEGDIDAVRKHFKTFTTSPTFPSSLTKTACLAVTPSSYKSFSNADRKGDYRGFLTAIDPNYDPEKSTRRKDKTGFNGHFNIIDQLVWTDLFALQANLSSQHAQEYWRLATPHPWGVYVGPTTGVKRKQWRLMGEGARGLAKFLKK